MRVVLWLCFFEFKEFGLFNGWWVDLGICCYEWLWKYFCVIMMEFVYVNWNWLVWLGGVRIFIGILLGIDLEIVLLMVVCIVKWGRNLMVIWCGCVGISFWVEYEWFGFVVVLLVCEKEKEFVKLMLFNFVSKWSWENKMVFGE